MTQYEIQTEQKFLEIAEGSPGKHGSFHRIHTRNAGRQNGQRFRVAYAGCTSAKEKGHAGQETPRAALRLSRKNFRVACAWLSHLRCKIFRFSTGLSAVHILRIE